MTTYASTPDGTRLALDDAGGPGEPVLLVCGQGQDRHFWQGFSQALMAAAPGRWRPIALDPRGIGDSDPLPPADTGPWQTRDMAHDLVAVLDTLGLPRSHLIGFSLGGRVAQWFAVDHGDRLGALVLAGTTPGNAHGVPRDPEVSAMLARGDLAALAGTMVPPDRAAAHADALPGLMRRRPIALPVLRRYYEASEAHDAWVGLATAEAPTLVLHGTQDPVNVPDNARLLAERLPHAELAWIEGARHAPFWSHLPATVEAVSAFLADRKSVV